MTRRIFTMLLLVSIIGIASQKEASAQIFSTKIKVTVIDPLGNVVEDAKVVLYKNKSDYEKEVNPVQKFKLTNAKGQVTFKKLTADTYYILVTKGDMSNIGAGEKVENLVAGRLNKANIVISDGL